MKTRDFEWENFNFDFIDLEDLAQNITGRSFGFSEMDEGNRDSELQSRPKQLVLDLGVSPFAWFDDSVG